MHTTKLIGVSTQCEPEIIDFNLLASGVVCILGSTVAHLKNKVGDDFIENTDSFWKGFRWEGRMRSGVAISEKEEAD